MNPLEQAVAYFKDKPDVVSVYAFGSYADGTATKRSDLDLVVVRRTEERFMDRLRRWLDLDKTVGMHVDLLVYNEAEWELMRHNTFFRNATLRQLV